eukprot:5184536-Amphidinium_carterae.3
MDCRTCLLSERLLDQWRLCQKPTTGYCGDNARGSRPSSSACVDAQASLQTCYSQGMAGAAMLDDCCINMSAEVLDNARMYSTVVPLAACLRGERLRMDETRPIAYF